MTSTDGVSWVFLSLSPLQPERPGSKGQQLAIECFVGDHWFLDSSSQILTLQALTTCWREQPLYNI